MLWLGSLCVPLHFNHEILGPVLGPNSARGMISFGAELAEIGMPSTWFAP